MHPFLSSYEKLRQKILSESTLTSLIRPEYHAFFDSAFVPICSFTLFNRALPEYEGTFIDLKDFYGADLQPVKVLEAIANPDCGYLYHAKASDFGKIPSSAIAYWVSDRVLKIFEREEPVNKFVNPAVGLQTSDNNRFLRYWFEVSIENICFNAFNHEQSIASYKKWFPYNKGGEFRKWYGNQEFVVNWENDGYEIKNFKDPVTGKYLSRPQGYEFYFLEGASWSAISSSNLSCRKQQKGTIFSNAGMAVFGESHKIIQIESVLNSNVGNFLLKVISPTLNYGAGEIGNLPLKVSNFESEPIDRLESK